jgi:hypothetical protein
MELAKSVTSNEDRLSSFDLADVLAEYSRAVRHSLISIESLHDVPGTDRERVSALAQSVRRSHAQTTTVCIASPFEANSAAAAGVSLDHLRTVPG